MTKEMQNLALAPVGNLESYICEHLADVNG